MRGKLITETDCGIYLVLADVDVVDVMEKTTEHKMY